MIRRIIQIDKEKCTGCGLCTEKCPQKKAPTGRMRKDSANTPKVSSSATVGSPGGMSTSAMTVAK